MEAAGHIGHGLPSVSSQSEETGRGWVCVRCVLGAQVAARRARRREKAPSRSLIPGEVLVHRAGGTRRH